MTDQSPEPAPEPTPDPLLMIPGLLAKQVLATERIAKYLGWILAIIVLSEIVAFVYGFAIGIQESTNHAAY